MNTPILHQYPASPFSEKVRLILGYKRLAYRTVEIPVAMPKPDLMPLTGGYRRTPVLQLGCDVYCDTRLIAAVLDALAPEPPLSPKGRELSVASIAQWADQTLFPTATPLVFQPEALVRMAADIPQAQAQSFLEDRMQIAQSARVPPLGKRIAFLHMPAYLALLEAQLSSVQYLEGPAPTLADFAVYHPLWFLARGVSEMLAPCPGLRAWMERIAAIGHGQPSALGSDEALAIARAATPQPRAASLPADTSGIKLGDRVQVSPTDYALDATEGTLCHLAADELALEREDPRAGRVVVHFPRIGFQLKRAGG
jgi:glutathione S-transferase